MTNQEIFNHVVTHLREQGQPAVSTDGLCSYRTPDGLSCAVGCLIDEDEYQEEMDANGYQLGKLLRAFGEFRHFGQANLALLVELQRAHDNWFVDNTTDLVELLRRIGVDFDLDTKLVQDWEGSL